jgi:quercetin dioxygenase-like cupin family protein
VTQTPRFPPVSNQGWHTHPGEEVGSILAGTVSRVRDHPTLIVHTGNGFLIPPGLPHNTLVGPDTGHMLSTYIVEVGKPLAQFSA